MAGLRPGLPVLPARMCSLPIDERGYPVPWFVAWLDGKPDFRIIDPHKLHMAMVRGACWVCGEKVGKYKTFVIGPMCAVNRTSSEPPCHLDCAIFAATACPFLRLPNAQRREANLPDAVEDPAGIMLRRNPGVTLLWTTYSYRRVRVENGILFSIGDPVQLRWYCQARPATRQEILDSIDSGMPALREIAEGAMELEDLQKKYDAVVAMLA